MSEPKPIKLLIAQNFTLFLTGLLVLCFSVWQITRPGHSSILFWLVQCVPLLVVLPGMWLQKPRAYIWLCFLMLVYFIKGVDGMVFPSRAWVDYVILAGSISLFISAMMSARWLQQFLIQSQE